MIRITTIVLMLALAGTWSRADVAADLAAGDAQLAERMADMAQRALRLKTVADANWRQARELLQAAVRLNPDESRFSRLLADAAMQMRDTNGAIAALSAYRKLVPDDRVAQIQLIDLYSGKMETADMRLAYLKDIIGRATVPDEVRSYAATLCAKLLFEQAQESSGEAMLGQAIRILPQNQEALRMRYARQQRTGTPFERINTLLTMLRANPAQMTVLMDMADQLAGLGLIEQSVFWYGFGLQVGQRAGTQFAPETLLNYVAALYVGDQAQSAENFSVQLLKAKPEDVDLHFLRLLITKSSSKKEDFEAEKKMALNALSNQLAVVRGKAGVSGATTRPVDSPDALTLPDLSGDPQLLEKAAQPSLVGQYISAAADLAWFYLYFQNDVDSADKIIATLRTLLPADNLTLTRLEGWSLLLSGKNEEARAKLAISADRDPLSAMGLIRLNASDTAQKEKMVAQARQLINENAGGLRGAMLWEGLHDFGGKFVLSIAAEAVRTELEKFPKDWLHIVDLPQNFYALRGEPLQGSYNFREPMLGRVTIQNLSDYPLTIGADGVIKADLWFDGQIKGLVQQGFPGIAYERLGQSLLLGPRQSVSQVVRIDRGDLNAAISSSPTVPLQVQVTLTSNPVMNASNLVPGPCGYRVQFLRLFSRVGSKMNTDDDKQKAYQILSSGTPAQKFSTIELLATYAQAFRGKDTNDQLKHIGAEFIDSVVRTRRDANRTIGAWAAYVAAFSVKPEDRTSIIDPMLKDEAWPTRFLGVLATEAMGNDAIPEKLRVVAESDSDPSVKAMAGVMIELAKSATTQPAATQPVLNPVTQPAINPATTQP